MMNLSNFNDIQKTHCDNLIIETYTIGYTNQGESIVLLVKDGNEVKYSILIDCFQYSNENKAIDILIKNKIKYIDLLIITQPHYDHCFGLEKIIEEYVNEKTKIEIPLEMLDYLVFGKKKVKKQIKCLGELIKNNGKTPIESCSEGKEIRTNIDFTDCISDIPFTIKSLSPNTARLNQLKLNNTDNLEHSETFQGRNPNDFSIVLYIKIAD